ncbi:Phosphatidylinositol glycan anchor biosynthesis class U protein [Linum perenne]
MATVNTEEESKTKSHEAGGGGGGFWRWTVFSVVFRLILIYFPGNLNLSSRPEVSTPLTSLRRLSEGYWLKQSSMSPYAGSMYHGSPLLLSVLGPLTVKRYPLFCIFNVKIGIEGLPSHILCSLVFVLADLISAILIRATGQKLQRSYRKHLTSLNLLTESTVSGTHSSGDIAALVYLWNPFTIVSCVGSSTSPMENLFTILTLYGAATGLAPLAAFGWVMATHLSLYPVVLIIPVILLLGYGPDAPPSKLFQCKEYGKAGNNQSKQEIIFSWRRVLHLLVWTSLWSIYLLVLCSISVKQYGSLKEMFQRTYGFILTVEDLSPNIGVLWYFFAEVFDFFRDFFLIVFHSNILFMIIPLAIRLKHRPCFLAFIYVAISSMLKSYPSVGDSALYLGLLGLFLDELADMQFSFFLFCGYVGVSLLSPVMHNLWIWRGTGNANFYYATAMAYACLQIVLVVESVSSMLKHDRKLTKLSASKLKLL